MWRKPSLRKTKTNERDRQKILDIKKYKKIKCPDGRVIYVPIEPKKQYKDTVRKWSIKTETIVVLLNKMRGRFSLGLDKKFDPVIEIIKMNLERTNLHYEKALESFLVNPCDPLSYKIYIEALKEIRSMDRQNINIEEKLSEIYQMSSDVSEEETQANILEDIQGLTENYMRLPQKRHSTTEGRRIRRSHADHHDHTTF
jgi:hypothetical protein